MVLVCLGAVLLFQSQTRRLLPRNKKRTHEPIPFLMSFNRRRDACFPATSLFSTPPKNAACVSIADATLASPQLASEECFRTIPQVSIADATLASPQRQTSGKAYRNARRVSIADATLASPQRSCSCP